MLSIEGGALRPLNCVPTKTKRSGHEPKKTPVFGGVYVCVMLNNFKFYAKLRNVCVMIKIFDISLRHRITNQLKRQRYETSCSILQS